MKLRTKPHRQVGQKWLTCDLECEHCEECEFCPLLKPEDKAPKNRQIERRGKKKEKEK